MSLSAAAFPISRFAGKGEKTRYLPLHTGTNELIRDYLDLRQGAQSALAPAQRC
jgi:site-specific recombinase XerC